MSNVLFLLGAIALSMLGTAVLVWRNRQPTRIDSGIRDFEREMKALSPEARRAAQWQGVRERRGDLGRAGGDQGLQREG